VRSKKNSSNLLVIWCFDGASAGRSERYTNTDTRPSSDKVSQIKVLQTIAVKPESVKTNNSANSRVNISLMANRIVWRMFKWSVIWLTATDDRLHYVVMMRHVDSGRIILLDCTLSPVLYAVSAGVQFLYIIVHLLLEELKISLKSILKYTIRMSHSKSWSLSRSPTKKEGLRIPGHDRWPNLLIDGGLVQLHFADDNAVIVCQVLTKRGVDENICEIIVLGRPTIVEKVFCFGFVLFLFLFWHLGSDLPDGRETPLKA